MTSSTPTATADVVAELRPGAISRTTLALFAGASGDHNPIHIDIDSAKASGMEDVFAHGMLSMAYLGRLLTDWIPQSRIRELSTRFTAITPVHAEPVLTAAIKRDRHGRRRAACPPGPERGARRRNPNPDGHRGGGVVGSW